MVNRWSLRNRLQIWQHCVDVSLFLSLHPDSSLVLRRNTRRHFRLGVGGVESRVHEVVCPLLHTSLWLWTLESLFLGTCWLKLTKLCIALLALVCSHLCFHLVGRCKIFAESLAVLKQTCKIANLLGRFSRSALWKVVCSKLCFQPSCRWDSRFPFHSLRSQQVQRTSLWTSHRPRCVCGLAFRTVTI